MSRTDNLRSAILTFCGQWRSFQEMQRAHLGRAADHVGGVSKRILWGAVNAMVEEEVLISSGDYPEWEDKRRNEWTFDRRTYLDARLDDTAPLCSLCGRRLSLQNSEHWVMACSGEIFRRNGKHEWLPGRSAVDDHYEKSRREFGDYDNSKICALQQRLIAARAELEKLKNKK